MDKLNSLVIFVRAAQYLSFSEAARQLYGVCKGLN
jgi:DNA-binding transcriptional LysR family regulator